MPAPTKNERQKCWDARDNFWNCLTENNDNESKCTEFKKVFEAQCTKQWAKYFMRRRSYLQYEDKLKTEGFKPADEKPKKKS
ncbi:hypothetical protein LSH36_154g01022 [Paralvinella palmiformis]|uniref:Cytochrome c oxidase assembly factor 6 homolog n=1 Tax=Paralvinella palmiformis TaxID=53620 RepID=A0AAD9N8W0_9ANNE|nr:hypothetical protein LSH36_154g01022 [Paralvinella palmiformis]